MRQISVTITIEVKCSLPAGAIESGEISGQSVTVTGTGNKMLAVFNITSGYGTLKNDYDTDSSFDDSVQVGSSSSGGGGTGIFIGIAKKIEFNPAGSVKGCYAVYTTEPFDAVTVTNNRGGFGVLSSNHSEPFIVHGSATSGHGTLQNDYDADTSFDDSVQIGSTSSGGGGSAIFVGMAKRVQFVPSGSSTLGTVDFYPVFPGEPIHDDNNRGGFGVLSSNHSEPFIVHGSATSGHGTLQNDYDADTSFDDSVQIGSTSSGGGGSAIFVGTAKRVQFVPSGSSTLGTVDFYPVFPGEPIHDDNNRGGFGVLSSNHSEPFIIHGSATSGHGTLQNDYDADTSFDDSVQIGSTSSGGGGSAIFVGSAKRVQFVPSGSSTLGKVDFYPVFPNYIEGNINSDSGILANPVSDASLSVDLTSGDGDLYVYETSSSSYDERISSDSDGNIDYSGNFAKLRFDASSKSTQGTFKFISYDNITDLKPVYVDQIEITIKLWDHGIQDNDHVRVWLNNEQIYVDLELLKSETKFTRTINSGVNFLKVEALNEGDYEPNTASVQISNVIMGTATQQWNLRIGSSATLEINYW